MELMKVLCQEFFGCTTNYQPTDNRCKCHHPFHQTHLKLLIPIEFVKGQNCTLSVLYMVPPHAIFSLFSSFFFTVIVMLLRITWICPMTFDNFPLDVQVLSYYWILDASQQLFFAIYGTREVFV